MSAKRAKATAAGGGRSDFLSASKSVAITETIKKEERTFHRLLQTQIELGRIVLPEEPEQVAEGEDEAVAAANSEQVGERLAWLLAAHRGTGQAPGAAAAEGQQEEQEDSEEVEEARAAAESAQLQQQLNAISRSLWGAVSAGAASGTGTYTSRSQADYQYSQEAVQTMRSTGELDSTHHHRRDAHAAFVEACARDAFIRRGGASPAKPDK